MRNRIADEELAAEVGIRLVRCIQRRSTCAKTGCRCCRRQVFREIADALQRVWHDGIEVHRIDLTQSPIAAKEKRLIFNNRTAERRTEIVNMQRGLAGLPVRGRVEVGFAMELKDGAMHLVGAGLGDDGYDAGACAAVLRAEVIRLYNELLNRIRVGESI